MTEGRTETEARDGTRHVDRCDDAASNEMVCMLQLPSTVTQEHRDMLRDLFDWLIQPCLDFVRLKCKMLVQSSPNHLIVMMLRLFHCMLDEIINSGEPGYETLSSPQVSWLHP